MSKKTSANANSLVRTWLTALRLGSFDGSALRSVNWLVRACSAVLRYLLDALLPGAVELLGIDLHDGGIDTVCGAGVGRDAVVTQLRGAEAALDHQRRVAALVGELHAHDRIAAGQGRGSGQSRQPLPVWQSTA